MEVQAELSKVVDVHKNDVFLRRFVAIEMDRIVIPGHLSWEKGSCIGLMLHKVLKNCWLIALLFWHIPLQK